MAKKTLSEQLKETAVIHLHTDLGSPDGAGKISDYMDRFKEIGVNYATVTDHGSLSAIYQFYRQAKKKGINPGVGVELYLNEKRDREDADGDADGDNLNPDDDKNDHLVVTAKNEIGIYNIIQLNNEATLHGFYRKPRSTTPKVFEKGDGILVSTACLAGTAPRLVLQKRMDDCERWLSSYKERFGEDFYIELHINKIKEQKIVNDAMIDFAKKLKIKMIVGQDCHYVNDGENIFRIIKMLDKRRETLAGIEKLNGFPDYLKWLSEETLYVKSNDEIVEKNKEWNCGIDQKVLIDALINCQEWHYKTKVHWDLSKKHYNKFNEFPPEYKSAEEYFDMLVAARFEEYLNKGYLRSATREEYQQQIEDEKRVLKDKGFVDYLLETHQTIHDIYEMTGNEMNVGVGRGSAAGSLVAYILGITKIDPMMHGLLFSRFLNEARSNEVVDVDI